MCVCMCVCACVCVCVFTCILHIIPYCTCSVYAFVMSCTMHDKAKLYRKADIIIIQVPSHIQGNILIHSRNHNTTITRVHCTWLILFSPLMTSGAMYLIVPTALVRVCSNFLAVPKSHSLSNSPSLNSRTLRT